MNENPISRRRALGAGALFLGAGLAAAAPVPGTAAATSVPAIAAPTVGLTTNIDDLVADSKRAVEEYHRGDRAILDAHQALREALSDEQWALFHAYQMASFAWEQQSEELLVAELCRHLPGLAPAIRALQAHLYSEQSEYGACCLPDGSPS